MARRTPNVRARTRFKQRLLFGLVLKPLRLFCERCDKYVPSDLEWLCSHCNHENVHTRIYSYLNKCKECKRSPKSYVCPHCGEINFLDTDADASHPARSSRKIAFQESADDARERRRREHDEQKEQIEREIVMTRLSAELVRLKASIEFKKETSVRERLEKSFSEHDAHVMGAHMIAKEQRRKNSELFRNDSEMLEMANESVTNWLESQL